jgi:pimeloyl-ACP methyl ester carboxylesterase
VHGISQTAWSWAPVARRIRAASRTLGIDLRGHGHSDSPRGGYELSSLAWDVLTVLAATGSGVDVGGPPAAVAGHGLGAMVAATMAVVQPSSIAGVALLDGGWEDIGEATRLSRAEFLAAIAEPPEVLTSMDAFLDDRQAFDPGTWDADQERAARAQVDQKHAGHVALVSRPVAVRGMVDAMYAYRPGDVLPRIGCPMVVLVAESGAADDEVVRERRLALDDMVRERRRSGALTRVVRFAGAGHNLMRYRPAEVAAELLALQAISSAGQPQR